MILAHDAAPDTVIGTKSEKMPSACRGNVDIVCQAKTLWVWTLTHWFEMLKGRLSVSATNATRPVVQQGRLSMLYVHAKGLSLWLTETCHWFPPVESLILQHNLSIIFAEERSTKRDKYLPSKVLILFVFLLLCYLNWYTLNCRCDFQLHDAVCFGIVLTFMANPAVRKRWTCRNE